MPDIKPRVLSANIEVRNIIAKTDDFLKQLSIGGSSAATSKRLQDALQKGGIVVKDNPTSPGGKTPYVVISPRQPWVDSKGELRLFNTALVHPDWNVAVFEEFGGCALIWFSGLKVGSDYSAKVKVKAFPKDVVNGPTPNEPGTFAINAGGNQFNIKPTYKEQIIPVSFIKVSASWAGIFITGQDDLLTWDFYEVSIIEMVL